MQNLYRKGVGAFIVNDQKKVFMAKRIYPEDAWQLPQGGAEEYESPKEALLRELQEEIGTTNIKILGETPPLKYNLPEASSKTFFKGKYKGQEQIWFGCKFLGSDNEINLNATSEPEFSEWKWEEPFNIVNIIIDFKKDLYRSILKYMQELKVI